LLAADFSKPLQCPSVAKRSYYKQFCKEHHPHHLQLVTDIEAESGYGYNRKEEIDGSSLF